MSDEDLWLSETKVITYVDITTDDEVTIVLVAENLNHIF